MVCDAAQQLGRRKTCISRYKKSVKKHSLIVQCAKSSSSAQVTATATDGRYNKQSGCPRGALWTVHKLGGACVATPEVIDAAAGVMQQNAESTKAPAGAQFLVVSAMGGSPKVTDLLLSAVEHAASRDESYRVDVDTVVQRYTSAAKSLLEEPDEFLASLQADADNVLSMLGAMASAGMSAPAFRDYVAGHGEIWCAKLVTTLLQQKGMSAAFLDARDVLTVSESLDGQTVDIEWEASNRALDQWWSTHCSTGSPDVVVCTGFIASDTSGHPTTLRRNGSDYSATAFGGLLQCREITIWSDVDGVFSADPRKVPEAVALQQLSYNEAWELSYFGANVLHPRTTVPAMSQNVPVVLRNFFNLSNPGTRISADATIENAKGSTERKHQFDRPALNQIVKGFSTIDDVSMINVEGTGMVGVQGTAASIFNAVSDAGCNVIMISQASSEHSVSFAVKTAEAEAAVSAVTRAFSQAIADGRIWRVGRIDGCTVLAAVGQRMSSTYGVCAMLFDALAKASVNVIAVAQGSSEYNVTTVVSEQDSSRALAAVHSRFYLSETPIGLGIIGPGQIGGTLLQQFSEQADYLRKEFNIDLRLFGIADTSKMVCNEYGIAFDSWQALLDSQDAAEDTDIDRFTQRMLDNPWPNKVIVDCSSSDILAGEYLNWLKQGIHVVTPNKKANSGPLQYYKSLREQQRRSYTHYFYEATVGAGLPILSTLQQLRETGDRVQRVEGILSGTLSYIFNVWDSSTAFSSIVKQAQDQGFTEPDPRDDLNGMDVARKVVILARECGMDVELNDLEVESLVPEELTDVSVEEFMKRLPEHDGKAAKRLEEANQNDSVLRFVGVVDVQNKYVGVKLGMYPADHPFASMQGTDNILSFQTKRYSPPSQPLVIRGPGAGAEVTAGGVFADVLKVAARLGAPS